MLPQTVSGQVHTEIDTDGSKNRLERLWQGNETCEVAQVVRDRRIQHVVEGTSIRARPS